MKSHSPVALSSYQLVLYRRALHPELFTLKQRRQLRRDGCDLEVWVMPAGHVARYQNSAVCLTELVTPDEGRVPADGAVTTFPCVGEKDFEHTFAAEKSRYVTTVQTESLSENLYRTTYDELMELGRDSNALIHAWKDGEGGRCASIVETQHFAREMHVQSYHLQATGGFVLRTQTMFSLV